MVLLKLYMLPPTGRWRAAPPFYHKRPLL